MLLIFINAISCNHLYIQPDSPIRGAFPENPPKY